MSYGSGQRIAFAGLVVGSLLCISGAIAPFWQEGSMSLNDVAIIFGEKIPFIGNYEVFMMYGGLWWYCVDIIGEKSCEGYKLSNDRYALRTACVVNVLLTLLCALVALCRTCCCAGGKTSCHGILAFLAGGAGITCVGIFAATANEGFAMKLLRVKFGWAFYVYAVGAAVVTLVSSMLCFALPNNPITPVATISPQPQICILGKSNQQRRILRNAFSSPKPSTSQPSNSSTSGPSSKSNTHE